jgi:hypothetical protein
MMYDFRTRRSADEGQTQLNALWAYIEMCFKTIRYNPVSQATICWRVIAPHHEQAGGFMADGLYRLTGKPGVIIGNEGPGVTGRRVRQIENGFT